MDLESQLSLPNLPKFAMESPEVVQVLDRIRYEIDSLDESGELSEFYWFAREYPRFYRYHIEHAEYRLKEVIGRYRSVTIDAIQHSFRNGSDVSGPGFNLALSTEETHIIYYDFESYISAVNNALDLLARIISTAYKDPTPVSFNKICAKKELDGIVDILRTAKKRWVNRLKDYRDCFTHYTPVDNRVFLSIHKKDGKFIPRCGIPVNPNVRESLGFRYSQKIELLKYSCTTLRHLRALDRSVARELKRMYKAGVYPSRTSNLFFVGHRVRK